MNGTEELMVGLRVLGSVAVVLVLVVLSARLARRAGVRGPGTGLKVVDRTGLTREASVAVVEVAGKALVLGVTSHGVNVLAELDPKDISRAKGAAAAGGPARAPLPRVVRIPTVAEQAGPAQAAGAGTGTGQAGGSILSPGTWRQGLEALRDLTTRTSSR